MIARRQMLLQALGLLAAGPSIAAGKSRRAPSLEGLWTNASYTELQRPAEFTSLVAGADEARAWEARLARTGGVNVPVDPVGQAQSEFPETGSGLARIRGEIRTSLIVDPPDGQIPYSPAARKALRIGAHGWRSYDNPEDRPHNERCLATASTGAPILPSEDANVLQIVQTGEHVVVLTEKYHDARIIRLGGPTGPPAPRSWLGDSLGHWEGDTLVVRTEGLRAGVIGRGDELYLSGESRVDERFTRTGPDEILYGFKVTDPSLFTQPWQGEMVFRASRGAIFEYACHEGNYSIVTILTAARLGRQEPSDAGPEGP